jgi:hypothetical protein
MALIPRQSLMPSPFTRITKDLRRHGSGDATQYG